MPIWAQVLLVMCGVSTVFNTVGVVVVYIIVHGASAPVMNGRMRRLEAEVAALRTGLEGTRGEMESTLVIFNETTGSILNEVRLMRSRFSQLDCVVEKQRSSADDRRKDAEDLDRLDAGGEVTR